MNDMVKVFDSKEFGSIRTIEDNNKIMFMANDVARAL